MVNLFQIPHGSWLCVTVVVLLGPFPEFGGIIHRIFQRVLGTIAGAMSAVVILYFLHDYLYIQTLLLGLLIPFFGIVMFKKYPYAYLIAVMTAVIILGVGEGKSLEAALWRSGNIIMGGLVTLLFSMIFPVRGTRELKFEFAKCLHLIDHLYVCTINGEYFDKHYLSEVKNVIISIRKQRKIVEHVIKESKHFRVHQVQLDECIVIMRKMSGIVELLNSSAFSSEIGNKFIGQLYSIQDRQEFLSDRIHQIILQLEKNSFETPSKATMKLTSSRSELQLLYEDHQDEHTPLSPYSYVWLNYQYAQQVFKLEERIDILFNRK
ncbi:FUSC family protein [Flammeovirga pectinis]|nr:FUSC family protein [Flammeovirga pectinis]